MDQEVSMVLKGCMAKKGVQVVENISALPHISGWKEEEVGMCVVGGTDRDSRQV